MNQWILRNNLRHHTIPSRVFVACFYGADLGPIISSIKYCAEPNNHPDSEDTQSLFWALIRVDRAIACPMGLFEQQSVPCEKSRALLWHSRYHFVKHAKTSKSPPPYKSAYLRIPTPLVIHLFEIRHQY